MTRKRLKRNQTSPDLTSMSVEELKKLKAKINFLIDNSDEDSYNDNFEIFYELLTKKLYKVLRTTYSPFPVFKKQQSYKKLIAVVDYLDELLESIFSKPKKLWYRKMYRMYIDLVIGEIQQSPLPLEIPIILNFKARFPAILDNNFPGYLENGLFKVIFKKDLGI